MVELLHVLADHASGVEARQQGRDRALGHAYPARRKPRWAAVVIHRDDLILQQFVQGLAFLARTARIVQVLRRRLDAPAVVAVVALAPPAVEHRQVEHAVHPRLHAGGAARLERIHRVVQPDIDPRHDSPRKAQVVTLEQQQPPLEARQARDLVQPADQRLPGLVGRVRLARVHEQHRPLGIGDQVAQEVEVLEHHRRALVGREPACEADGQYVRIVRVGMLEQPVEVRLGAVVAQVLHARYVVDQVQHARLQRLAHAPEQVVRDVVDALPELCIALARKPVGAEVALEDLHPLLGQERRYVHPVGDVVDRILFRRDLRPQFAADLGRHAAMDLRDAVLKARAADRQRRHVEVAVAHAVPERHELRMVQPELRREALEVRGDHRFGEMVMPRRHRRVGGEHGVHRDRLQRSVEGEATGGQLAHALEHQEGRMALVDVPDGGRDTQRAQCAHAADAEHDFLLDAGGAVATVEPAADLAVRRRIGLDIAVEQVQRDMAAARAPHVEVHGAPGHLDLHHHLRAVRPGHPLDRQVVVVGVAVGGVLVALAIDRLREVALPVQQTDRDERQPRIARGLAMVAGKDAQSAGIDREAFVEAVLGAEVGDRVGLAQPFRTVPAHRLVVVGVVGRQRAVQVGQEHRVVRRLDQACLVDPLQEGLRIVAGGIPQSLVQQREQPARLPVPAVPEVVRKLVQPREPARDVRLYFDRERRRRSAVHR